jgi:crotonobetainyl-CoA:carnitine CoA-transferase CaiB-like acyl-CoA transferase
VRFTEAPASVRRPAPLIGADTDEVLAEVGLTAEEIEKLHVSGVIPAPPELG